MTRIVLPSLIGGARINVASARSALPLLKPVYHSKVRPLLTCLRGVQSHLRSATEIYRRFQALHSLRNFNSKCPFFLFAQIILLLTGISIALHIIYVDRFIRGPFHLNMFSYLTEIAAVLGIAFCRSARAKDTQLCTRTVVLAFFDAHARTGLARYHSTFVSGV
jgi:hypothetical protein